MERGQMIVSQRLLAWSQRHLKGVLYGNSMYKLTAKFMSELWKSGYFWTSTGSDYREPIWKSYFIKKSVWKYLLFKV